MNKPLLSTLMIALALAGCGKADDKTGGTQQAGGAQVAYGYSYRFALPGNVVTQAQDKHIAMCDALGPARCRLQEMHRSAGVGQSSGSTRFVVAAGDARPFGKALVAPVAALRGELASRDFEAEDVSSQIADAQATAAEKNNAANRAAVSDVRDRVRTSSIWVYYDGTAGFGEQVGDAFGAAGDTLTSSVAALIYFLAAALPWAVVFAALFFGIRALVRRLRRLLVRAEPSG